MSRWAAFSKAEVEIIRIALGQLYGRTTDDREEIIAEKLNQEIDRYEKV